MGEVLALVQALAKEFKLRFIVITPSVLLSKWYGETSQLVSALWSLARKWQPAVIFIGGWVAGWVGAAAAIAYV